MAWFIMNADTWERQNMGKKKPEDLDLAKALARMHSYSSKTRSVFAKALKLKAPDTHGRLAGSPKLK